MEASKKRKNSKGKRVHTMVLRIPDVEMFVAFLLLLPWPCSRDPPSSSPPKVSRLLKI